MMFEGVKMNLREILTSRLLLVVIVEQKNKLNSKFKFEPIITNHL